MFNGELLRLISHSLAEVKAVTRSRLGNPVFGRNLNRKPSKYEILTYTLPGDSGFMFTHTLHFFFRYWICGVKLQENSIEVLQLNLKTDQQENLSYGNSIHADFQTGLTKELTDKASQLHWRVVNHVYYRCWYLQNPIHGTLHEEDVKLFVQRPSWFEPQ